MLGDVAVSGTAPVAGRGAQPGAQGTVRRVIVFLLLYVLVDVAAVGVSGLLGRLLETRPAFLDGSGSLALSLAFALIGLPLALVLWWFVWRRLDGADRSSVAWGLYLAAILTTALVTFTVSLLGMFADLIAGTWSPDRLATGITWLLVWAAHRWMWSHRTKSPLHLTAVPMVLGAAYGLGVGVSGAVGALAALFGAAIMPVHAQIGTPWWVIALQSLVWFVGGALVWWWHWARERVLRLRGGFADVALVLTGILAAGALTLFGIGTALYVGLRAAFDRSAPWDDLLDPLGPALAAAGIGAVVWVYHRRIARERSTATRGATRLVEAGLGLIGAASGLGVVINALLAALSAPLAGSDARALLLGGVAALVVGAPVWWLSWRPGREEDAGAAGRRIYLVAVFGVSAVVAVVALLTVGYRIFEIMLDTGAGGSLIERIRAPFGLLVATALVAAYHFAVWRRDRAALIAEAPRKTIDRVILIAGESSSPALEHAVAAATGATVTRWMRADLGQPAAETSPEAVATALAGVSAHRVVVITGPGGHIEVIPLAESAR